MFRFKRRKQQTELESLMEQTTDFVLCLQFAHPIEVNVTSVGLGENLKNGTVADISLCLAQYFGFENRMEALGIPLINLFRGDIPNWFASFQSEFLNNFFESHEKILPVDLGEDGEVFVRLHTQNILKNEKLYRQWLTLRDVTEEVLAEKKVQQDLNTKTVALDAGGFFTHQTNYLTGEVKFDWAGLEKTSCDPDSTTIPEIARSIPKEDIEKAIPEFIAYQQGKIGKFHGKFRLPAKHDGYRWFEAWGRASERDERGNVIASTGVFLDVTDEVELSDKLMSTQKLESLGVLAGGIAHDFNNLLMSILGYAGLGRAGLSKSETPEEIFTHIETSALHARDLCSQLLSYAGKESFSQEVLSVGTFLRTNSDLIQVSASRRANLQINAYAPVWVLADPGQLRQIVINLVANASDALEGQTGSIQVEVDKVACNTDYLKGFVGSDLSPGDFASIKVADTGVGMTAETIERIFDPFFTTKFTGRGLGMAVVMGVIRSHGGSIRINSHPGSGTQVEVLLPLADEPAESVRPDICTREIQVEGNVLVVDDEANVRKILSALLDRLQITAETVEDGGRALAALEKNDGKFGLVILDVTMPEVDGITVAYKILVDHPGLPIILTSGYTGQAVPADLLEQVVFLKKPFTLEGLSEAIQETLVKEASVEY